jgi:hypothetical protein
MTSAIRAFSMTSRVFENARSSRLTRHEIEFSPAAQVMRISAKLFQLLDRTDAVQAEISRRLWVLRSTVLYTVLPFDDPALGLQRLTNELEQASIGFPDTVQLIESLKRHVTEIVSDGVNRKRERLLHLIAGCGEKDDERIGVFCALSAGRPPGWPGEIYGYLAGLNKRITLIQSRRDLRSNVFGTVFLPCACVNSPSDILSDLLFSGAVARFEVLLYPGERFQMPKRLTLPDDSFFAGRLQKTKVENEVTVMPYESAQSEADAWINEAFWQGLHGAARSGSPGLVPANYMLFGDGTGTFLPAHGRVLTLPADGAVSDESDLCMVRVDNVCEGTLMVLRSGESGVLLDDASDRIMTLAGNESLFETATDWKDALDALLVTRSYEEVAQELRDRGAPTSAQSIHQWIGPDVLGPGSEHVFKELIGLLADKKKIQKTGLELTGYADSRWKSLQDLRSVRQKAGNLIRQDLFKALFDRFKNGNGKAFDRESIHIEGDNGVELLILRVSSVDRDISHVHASRLGQMDDLKGNKWLG